MHYFVDEAGDGNIFDFKGRLVVGNSGVSKHFVLGFTHIENPDLVADALYQLRRRIFSDDFFAHIASMDPAEKKTALLFHAHDDHPQVRYVVLDLIRNLPGLHFHAIVMNKYGVARFVTEQQAVDPLYKYRVNDLYNYMIRRLFYNRLHLASDIKVCFAERGTTTRSKALQTAISLAGSYFTAKCGKPVASKIDIICAEPKHVIELQVTDYFLWALQRYYEKGQRGYMDGLWNSVSTISYDDYSLSPAKTIFVYHKKKPLP